MFLKFLPLAILPGRTLMSGPAQGSSGPCVGSILSIGSKLQPSRTPMFGSAQNVDVLLLKPFSCVAQVMYSLLPLGHDSRLGVP